jgi:hypothetical protein
MTSPFRLCRWGCRRPRPRARGQALWTPRPLLAWTLRVLSDEREAQFVRGNLWRACFTEKQKAVIDKLRMKYQSRL